MKATVFICTHKNGSAKLLNEQFFLSKNTELCKGLLHNFYYPMNLLSLVITA